MRYAFFVKKIVKEIQFLPEDGFLIAFTEGDWFECYTKLTTSVEGYDLNKLAGKKIEKVLYEKDKFIVFCLDDVTINVSLLAGEWGGPEDVVYKDYNNPKKLIIAVIT